MTSRLKFDRKFFTIVALLLGVTTPQCRATNINISNWTIPNDGVPYPRQIAFVGDNITWYWNTLEVGEATFHSVNYHPSGDCSTEDQVVIHPQSSTGPALYTFQPEDEGNTMFFTCDIADHCQRGMSVAVDVVWITFPQEPAPAPAPTASQTLPPALLEGGFGGREETEPPTIDVLENDAKNRTNFNLTDSPTFWPTVAPTTSSPTTPLPTVKPTPNFTVDVVGTVIFSIIVQDGNLEQIPFTSYGPQLLEAVNALALQVADNIEEDLNENGRRSLKELQDAVHAEGSNRALRGLQENQKLRVDLPGSIMQVLTLGFTSSPEVTNSDTFSGGACPFSLGNVETDRCEQVTANIGLFVDNEDINSVPEIEAVFQARLDVGVRNGQLQSYLKAAHPDSSARIISGEVVRYKPDRDEEDGIGRNPKAVEEGNINTPEEDPSLPVGAITGMLVASVMAVSLIFLILLVSRQRQRLNIGGDSNGNTINKGSMDMTTIPANEVEWGYDDNEADGKLPDDVSKLSTDSPTPKPAQVIFVQKQSHYSMPVNDNASYISADGEDQKESSSITYSRDSSILSGLHSVSAETISTDYLGNRVLGIGPMAKNIRGHTSGVADFDDLEYTIIAGDWAALGETASSLANNRNESASDKQTLKSWDDMSRTWNMRDKTWQNVIDAGRAAELDKLIGEGDWAAIIDAAARYQAESKDAN